MTNTEKEIVEKIELTDLDRRILKKLVFEGMDPYSFNLEGFAEELKINPYTLNYKIKKYFDNKILLEKVFRFNYEALGLERTSWSFYILNKKRKFADVSKKLMEYPNVTLVSVISGDYGILVKVVAKDLDEMTEILNKIDIDFRYDLRLVSSIISSKTYKMNQKILSEKRPSKELSASEQNVLDYLINTNNDKIADIVVNTKLHRNTI